MLAAVIVRQPVASHAAIPGAQVVTDVPVWRYLLGFTRRQVKRERACAIHQLRWVMVSTTAMAFAAGGYNAFMLEYLKSPAGKGMSEKAATRRRVVIGLFGALAVIVVGVLARRTSSASGSRPQRAVDDLRST